MPVPSNISDLSKVASENSPAGTESAKGTIDDYFRAHAAFIRQLFDQLLGPTVTLASAATVNVGFAAAANITITGTSPISGFDATPEGTLRYVIFIGGMTLTHHPSNFQLPGNANIQTVPGDAALFKSLGNGQWGCLAYWRKSVGPVPANSTRDGYLSAADWATFNDKQAALGYTPYPAANPSNFISAGTAANTFLSKSGGSMTGPVYFAEGSQAQPGIAFASGDNDTGFFHMGDGAIGVVCNNVLVAKFTSQGLEINKVVQTQ